MLCGSHGSHVLNNQFVNCYLFPLGTGKAQTNAKQLIFISAITIYMLCCYIYECILKVQA